MKFQSKYKTFHSPKCIRKYHLQNASHFVQGGWVNLSLLRYSVIDYTPIYLSNPVFNQDQLSLTHWGQVTHICVGKLTIIGSENGLSPVRRQAIIWTNAGILLIRTLGTIFSEFLSKVHRFSFKKMRLKVSSAKWRPFCLGLNELNGNIHRWIRCLYSSLISQDISDPVHEVGLSVSRLLHIVYLSLIIYVI